MTGIEGVAAAIPAFEQEFGIKLQLDEDASGLRKHRTGDGRLAIVEGNFFDVTHPSLDHQFAAVWDRAALYALSHDLRIKYVETIKRLLAPDFRYLLTTMEYDETTVDKFKDLPVKEVVYLLTRRK